MKKKFTLILSMLVMVGLVYDYNHNSAHTYSNGAPAGHTGSPGDGVSCAKSGCHSGGPAQTNEAIDVSSDIPSTGYVGGATYNVVFTMTKPGGEKFGFELSPQDNAGAAVGELITGAETIIIGGHYITHGTGQTAATNGARSWSFQWTAPAAGTGDVDVYYAGNFSNNMFDVAEDVIVTGSLVVHESNVGISEAELSNIQIYPNPIEDEINIAMTDVDEEIMVTLYSVEGRVVFEERFSEEQMKIDLKSKSLNTGIYFLHLEVDGNSTVEKLLVK